ncbi:MAG: hypothetical protein JW819_06715 [Candidatus Krumholzibacteriota bacterium]|nr:hypothetical protein [Candidatus Krumholzibacteriota bacterium]
MSAAGTPMWPVRGCGRQRTAVLLSAGLALAVLLGAACSSRVQTARIFQEVARLDSLLAPDSEVADSAYSVIGFPQEYVEIGGRDYTIFRAGEIRYSSGSHGSPGDPPSGMPGSPFYDMGSPGTPSIPASVEIKAGRTDFALSGKLPIVGKRGLESLFTKRPLPYQLNVTLRSRKVRFKNEWCRVAECAAPDAYSSNQASTLSPRLPHHLEGRIYSALIVESDYSLGQVGASVPESFRLSCDHWNSLTLFDALSESNPTDCQADRDAFRAWFKAAPLVDEAQRFARGESELHYLAIDRPHLVETRRLEKSVELVSQATCIDSLWRWPVALLGEYRSRLDELRQGRTDGAPSVSGRRWFLTFRPHASFRFSGRKRDVGDISTPFTGVGADIGLHVQTGSVLASSLGVNLGIGTMVLSDDEDMEGWPELRASVHYVTPLRLQLSDKGYRLQCSANLFHAWIRGDAYHSHFSANGWLYGVSLEFIKRSGFDFTGEKPSGMWIGYRWGKFDDLRDRDAEGNPTLMNPDTGDPARATVRGLMIGWIGAL